MDEKEWGVKLTWNFGEGGLSTKLKDPLNPERNMPLTELVLHFQWHVEKEKTVFFELRMRGGTEEQIQDRQVYDVYGFIHELFGRGLTEYTTDENGVIWVIPKPAYCSSDTSWLESAIRAIADIRRMLGVTAELGNPTLEGDSAELVLAFLRS